MIDKGRLSVFNAQRAEKMSIPDGIRKDILQRNAQFNIQNFQYK